MLPTVKLYRRGTLADRFWRKVDKTPGQGPWGNCWGWNATQTGGYGMIWNETRMELASRISWLLHFGKFDQKAHILHRCDNPPCTNPDHLFLGDQASNMADMCAKNRKRRNLTEAQAIEIKLRLARGEQLAPIARALGVNKYDVNSIRRRRSWKHL